MQLLAHTSTPVQYIQPPFDSMAIVIQTQHRDTLCCMPLPLGGGMGCQKAALWHAATPTPKACGLVIRGTLQAANQSCGNCVSKDRRWPAKGVSVLWSPVTPKCRQDCASMFIEPCRWEASSEARTWANHQPATPTSFASLVQLVDAEEGNVREERTGVEELCNGAYFFIRSVMNCDKLTLVQIAALATGDKVQDGVRVAYSGWREQTYLS